jgi:hypothetical protein
MMNCTKSTDPEPELGSRESIVTAIINGKKYEAKTILKDNRSDPNRFGFASTDLRDTSIELDFPKFEIESNKVYDLKNQPWRNSDRITIFFHQPLKIGHYVFNSKVKFTKIKVDEYYEGEFEFEDNYYPNEVVNLTEGKFRIYL